MSEKASATTPEEYLAALEEPRRTQITELHDLIRETAPQLEPHIQAGMLAYGRYHYRYASGREGDWFPIGVASQKGYISLFITAATEGHEALADSFRERLPKADIGRSCALQAPRGLGPSGVDGADPRGRQVSRRPDLTARVPTVGSPLMPKAGHSPAPGGRHGEAKVPDRCGGTGIPRARWRRGSACR